MATNHLGAILAGGKSRRFGSAKALAELGGRTILDRVISTHRAAGLAPFVVADQIDRYSGCGVPVIVDGIADVGPIGGMHAALLRARASNAAGICVTGCDTPFLEPAMLTALISASRNHNAVVFLDERREAGQPLVAWYSMEVLPVVEAAIADRDLAMTRFTERLGGVHYLRADAVHLTRPLDAVFLNVNRPSDLEVAREYLQHYPDP